MLRCNRRHFLLHLYWRLACPAGSVSIWYTIWLWRRLGGADRAAEARVRPVRGRGAQLAQGLADEGREVLACLEWTKAGNGVGIGEVPLVFGDADKVANGRVARPGAPQRRLGELGRDPGLQKSA